MDSLAPLPFAVPLATAALLLAMAAIAPQRLHELISILCSAAVCGVCCALLLRSQVQPVVYWFGGWVPHQGVAVGVSFVVTPLGAGLAALASLLVTLALVFSIRYFDAVHGTYQVLMLAFEGAMCGFCLSGDLFNMFVWFELMGAAAYALTAYRMEERGPLQGALNFAILNTIGAYLVLCGLALLYGRTGALNLAQIGRAVSAQPPDGLVVVSFVLLAVGFLVKASVVPFHFWLADAHAVAPTPVCVLFSGVMVEVGVYAVARLYWTIFATTFHPHELGIRAILLGAGVVTALVGGLFCFGQAHLKRLLAFSTISHVGMFLCGFALLTPLGLAGSAVYVLGHGMVKAALFLCTGILLNRFATVDESQLHGRARDMLPSAILFLAGGLSLAGLPPFGTYLGKGMIEAAAASQGYGWLTPVLVIASILTGGAVLRAFAGVYLGMGPPEQDEASREGAEQQPESKRSVRTPVVMIAPACLLMGLGLAVGLIPNLGTLAEADAAKFLNQASYAQVVLDGVGQLSPAPGMESAGPDVSAVASGLVGTLGAVLLALAAVHRARCPQGIAAFCGEHVQKPLQRLRELQSGDVRDYVTWLTFGAASLGAAFAFVIR